MRPATRLDTMISPDMGRNISPACSGVAAMARWKCRVRTNTAPK
jgi:hypothetical protein